MKIGINAQFLSRPPCGNLIYLLNLINGLSKYDKNNEYILFITDDISINEVESKIDIKSENIKFKVISKKKYKYKTTKEWDIQFTNTEEFKSENIDILHCSHFAIPNKIEDQNIKIVVSIHDIIPSNMFNIKKFIKMGFPIGQISINGLLMKYKEPKMLKRADKVIVFSEYVKKDVYSTFKYPQEKINVIPHFPSNDFKVIQNENELIEIKNKFKLPDRFIIYFSGYHKRKNIKRLVKAFKKVIQEEPNIFLLFVGEGKEKTKLEKLNIKNLLFTGKVSRIELVKLINLSEFAIAPSLYEGFGLWIVEAMKCGKICLTSNNSPMQEIAKDSTLYFNPKNYKEIYEKIIKIIKTPELKRALEKKALNRVKLFTEENHIKDTIKIYSSLITIN